MNFTRGRKRMKIKKIIPCQRHIIKFGESYGQRGISV